MVIALLLAATLSPFDQVVAAERAFAAASLEKGLHEAFVLNLAPDSIAFTPLPGPALPAHKGQPPSRGTLTWGPAWVAVSSAGDLALSIGPFEARPPASSIMKVTTGWYISVWRSEPKGGWKVVVDEGVSSKLSFSIPTSVENGFAGATAKPPKPGDAANARVGVTTAERGFASAAKSGLGAAIVAQADLLVRVYREHQAAAIGTAEARTLLATDDRKVTCSPDAVKASASGDLAYTYGTCIGDLNDPDNPDAGPRKHGFLHVWRRQADGTWKILIDVTP